jgi:hypothetical protein
LKYINVRNRLEIDRAVEDKKTNAGAA